MPSVHGSGSKASGARSSIRATMPGGESVYCATQSTKRRMSRLIGGQSNTCSMGLNLRASTGSAPPSQTTPATCRGPSGTRTIDPGTTRIPSGTA
jgi:hypothetical protein